MISTPDHPVVAHYNSVDIRSDNNQPLSRRGSLTEGLCRAQPLDRLPYFNQDGRADRFPTCQNALFSRNEFIRHKQPQRLHPTQSFGKKAMTLGISPAILKGAFALRLPALFMAPC